ncbi:membrane-bound PQQ-dependent dehydrogenase, glucose/quinate/shikimate family [Croceicoccus sediminis]|uniref:membrane-bound PQQ-dependent dehydrogenase, glucose/quinate/shikimate family n=1 Tax=Croceicoccus sediminis TaxID=2571150 RepID=UPI001F0F93F9|nr:membrane-bound PQQ-dependent dehydrogenase, glucose/quinate/shikimate family [Croceicoccus sediminis]
MKDIIRLTVAFVVIVLGAAMSWTGFQIAVLGGSPYFVLAGVCLLAAGVLFALRRWEGVWLYALVVLATAAWWLLESDGSFWAFVPRLALLCGLGLILLTPWFRAGMGRSARLRHAPIIWSVIFIAAAGWVVSVFWLDQPHDTVLAMRDRPAAEASRDAGEWQNYGNDLGGSRHSALAQITPANVDKLEVAWTYHSGPTPDGKPFTFQANPLKIGDLVYICTGYNDVIALDAETGEQKWRHAARSDLDGVMARHCRGVSYYQAPEVSGTCSGMIYTATVDARLIALDSLTGSKCAGFGNDGEANLLDGMGDVVKGYYQVTSPPIVVRGKLIIGGWVTDGQHVGEPGGVIRAYDAVTGKFAWAFDPGNPDEQGMPPAGGQFTRGTPNSWAPMSGDEQLGFVFAPMGNATPDYVGMHRTELDERFSSSVLALNAETGKLEWVFQTTHHDLWDYDNGSQPVVFNLEDGTPALIQPTKRGQIFILDRRTGKPLFPVEERSVPTDGVSGERMAPTQPFSSAFPDFSGPRPTEARMWGLTPIDMALCRIKFLKARFDGTMTPLTTDRPTIVWPGYIGGMDWGSVSIDPDRKIMIVNNTQMSNYNQLLTREDADTMGLKPISETHQPYVGGPVPQTGTPYGANISPFLSPLGMPCQQPPLGRISGVDLKTGKLLWSHPLGTARDSGPFDIPIRLPIQMGTPNLGGSITTAGGLTFIGAAKERTFRAYETATGRKLWQSRLPASAQSTPATYWSSKSDRQFVIVPAGGYPGFSPPSGDALVAYALPRNGHHSASGATDR